MADRWIAGLVRRLSLWVNFELGPVRQHKAGMIGDLASRQQHQTAHI